LQSYAFLFKKTKFSTFKPPQMKAVKTQIYFF